MSWTARAERMDDTSLFGAAASIMCGRCRATGLDPTVYRSLIGASIALGVPPLPGLGSAPYLSDEDLVDDIVSLSIGLWSRGLETQRLITEVARRRAHVMRRLASTPRGDPTRSAWLSELADCATALEILNDVPPRLGAARRRLDRTPGELGDTYAAVYTLISAGRLMPHDGRWLTGEEAPCSTP